jgi:hypothetical protein
MQCPGCEHENEPAARLCEKGGAQLTRPCPSCGKDVGPQARFCPGCGATLREPAAARPTAPPQAGPDVAAPGSAGNSPSSCATSSARRRSRGLPVSRGREMRARPSVPIRPACEAEILRLVGLRDMGGILPFGRRRVVVRAPPITPTTAPMLVPAAGSTGVPARSSRPRLALVLPSRSGVQLERSEPSSFEVNRSIV